MIDLTPYIAELDQKLPATDWQLSGEPIKSRECHVYRLQSHSLGRTVALKLYRPDTNLTAPDRQFRALTKKQDPKLLAPSVTYRVPCIYSFNQQGRSLTMEWSEGTPLVCILWSFSTSRKKRIAVKQSGAWLKAFHAVPFSSQEEVDLSLYCQPLEQRLAACAAKPRNPVFDLALSTLHCRCEGKKDQAVHAINHGDFTPYNLLMHKTHVTGIDLWGLEPAPVFLDLARMTVYLTIAYPFFFGGTLFDGNGEMAPAINAFYEGYGLCEEQRSSRQLKLALLAEYLRRWVVISNRRPHRMRKLTDRFQIARIQQQVQSLLDNL